MIKDFSWSLVSKLLFNIFSFILTPLLINSLGDRYSVIVFFGAFTGFLAFVDGGYSFLIVKSIKDQLKLKYTFQSSETSLIYCSLIIGIVSFVFIKISGILTGISFIFILLGLSEGFLRIYMRILRSYSNSVGELVQYSKREVIYSFIRFILLLAISIMISNLFWIMMIMVVINLLFILQERIRINYKFDFKAFNLWTKVDLKFIFTHTFLSLLASTSVYLDKILIKSSMSEDLYINYMLAHKFSYILLILSNPIATIFIRYFSKESLVKFKYNIFTKLFSITIFAYIIFYYITPIILKLWLGNYLNENIINLSRIFIIGSFAMLLGQIPYSYFVSRSANKFQITISILGTFFTFINIYFYFLTKDHIQLAIGSSFIFVLITLIYFVKFYKHVFIKHNNTNIG
jgi:O-antigen/teichoic acid export membrane protein